MYKSYKEKISIISDAFAALYIKRQQHFLIIGCTISKTTIWRTYYNAAFIISYYDTSNHFFICQETVFLGIYYIDFKSYLQVYYDFTVIESRKWKKKKKKICIWKNLQRLQRIPKELKYTVQYKSVLKNAVLFTVNSCYTYRRFENI